MGKKTLAKPKLWYVRKTAKDVILMSITQAKKNITIARCMNRTPYPLKLHQSEGVQFMVQKEIEPGIKGGLLCDEPGMGKTIQIAALMKINQVSKTLLIVPVCVIKQWLRVMIDVFDKKNIYIHYGNQRARSLSELETLRTTNGKKNVENMIVISTYGVVNSSKSSKDHLLFDISWDRVVLDEGHIIRNKNTKTFKKANKLTRNYSWILTGTPLQNKLGDIKSLFKFINQTGKSITINRLIENNMIRRTKRDLPRESSLENLQIMNTKCIFRSKDEQDTYMALHRNLMGEYGEASLKLGDEDTWMEMLEQIIRLRQASIDSELAIKSFCTKFNIDSWSFSKKRSTKITCFLNKIKKVDGYSLVFCHFRQEMELIKKELEKEGIESELYHGSMSLQERKEVVDKFPFGEEKKKALIIQIKAGGVGLNLQQFTNIFIISPDWNPCNEIQAIARAHRIGQHKKVVVYKFTIVANKKFMDVNEDIKTIDQLIIQKQKLKRDLMVKTLNDKSLEFNETTV
tara:strand:+ start:38 stop:1582 length:1545 start_codon:yes stop_codon:yes gene_type:complete